MLPSFLITFREVIEASLIVATILGILVKTGQKKSVKTVWFAVTAAAIMSISLLGAGSLFGLKIQELYAERVENLFEGILMILSAIFITWAVFFLHNYFAAYKVTLLQKLKKTIWQRKQTGLFILVFTAVFREGFEIVLFLTTIYFSSSPQAIFSGFIGGASAGILASLLLFAATIRLPVYAAFKATSALLILFAAGLLTRGIHELAEAGIIAEVAKVHLTFMPASATVTGDVIKSIFGLTRSMDYLQITLYLSYTFFMFWWVFIKPSKKVL